MPRSDYMDGFRVGLATEDNPLGPQKGRDHTAADVLQTLKSVEVYILYRGEDWERGFWDGIKEQPNFQTKVSRIFHSS
jgi:hypothetical protein